MVRDVMRRPVLGEGLRYEGHIRLFRFARIQVCLGG